ncbi:5-formyltetrahydrofolate cyclo-ligase [Brevundimonas sp.]|uniref:5-formyltetrahydrofolate cyclo-ligase n=1 Tax=Brevundimonas sp. TaxID=1871086 RepID=UPI001D21E55F|nr:5-formyltetrahydrofolate cyclo-ligase [Brevundimonas sp.]MBA4001244.1 5-formyltetrahydrofolate cyclo-ligase [Brevundimonas sp.]
MTVKADLRAAMRGRRKQAADANPYAAERLVEHVGAMLDALFSPSRNFAPERPLTVALYGAQGSEMDTAPLARALMVHGLELALPVVVRRDAPLAFRRWRPGDPLELDQAGCPAPLDLAGDVTPDLIIVPLLAFDPSGGRLGQGGGYYDRTLEALRAVDRTPPIVAVGLAYATQEMDNLPMDSHDQPLDGVLTEAGYRSAKRISE